MSAHADRANPWPGIYAYTPADRDLFFGREEEIEQLVRLVHDEPLVTLYSASGLGKTSLLGAGLIPRLAAGECVPIWLRYSPSETGDAAVNANGLESEARLPQESGGFGSAAALVACCRAQAAAQHVQAPAGEARTLWEYFHRRDHFFWSRRYRLQTPVLILDQFEEIFTLGQANAKVAERTRDLLRQLADLIYNRPPDALRTDLAQRRLDPEAFQFDPVPLRVVLAFREDFLPQFNELKRAGLSTLGEAFLRLTPFTPESAKRCIEQPAPELLDPEVADELVRFLSGVQPGERSAATVFASRNFDFKRGPTIDPTLLSVVCRRLNDERQKRNLAKIPRGHFDLPLNRIVDDFYQVAVDGVTPELQHYVESELVSPTGYRDSRFQEDALARPGIDLAGLDRLVEGRLLRRLEGAGGHPRLELAHDLLCGAAHRARIRREVELKFNRFQDRRRKVSRILVGWFVVVLLFATATEIAVRGWYIAMELRSKPSIGVPVSRRVSREDATPTTNKPPDIIALLSKPQTRFDRWLVSQFTENGRVALAKLEVATTSHQAQESPLTKDTNRTAVFNELANLNHRLQARDKSRSLEQAEFGISTDINPTSTPAAESDGNRASEPRQNSSAKEPADQRLAERYEMLQKQCYERGVTLGKSASLLAQLGVMSLCGLLVYARTARRQLLLSASGLAPLLKRGGDASKRPEHSAASGPWWVAPWPDREVRQTFHANRKPVAAVAGISIAAVLAMVRLVQIVSDTALAAKAMVPTDWIRLFAFTLTMGSAVWGVAQVVAWWYERRVPTVTPRGTVTAGITRRHAIGATVIAAAVGLGFAWKTFLPRDTAIRRGPRFRARKRVRSVREPSLATGRFRHNPRSQVVHGVVAQRHGSPLFVAEDFPDPTALAARLTKQQDPVSDWLLRQFSPDGQRELKASVAAGVAAPTLAERLASEFNVVVRGAMITDAGLFARASKPLPQRHRRSVSREESREKKPKRNRHAGWITRLFRPGRTASSPAIKASQRMQWNRRLLTGAYPGLIASHRTVPVVHSYPLRPGDKMPPVEEKNVPLELPRETKLTRHTLAGTPHVQWHRAACAFEQAALRCVAGKDIDQACKFLVAGVRYDRQLSAGSARRDWSLHLADLLAGLAVRHNKPEVLTELVTLLEQSPRPSSAAQVERLASRLKRWRNPQSRWHRRWSNRGKPLFWSRLPM